MGSRIFFGKNLALSYQNKEKHRFSKRMWPFGQKHTHTHTSKVSSERSLRYLMNWNFPSPTLAEVLIIPLQCKECHPLLGGVVDLGRLPDPLLCLDFLADCLFLLDADTSPSCLPLVVEQSPHCIEHLLYLCRLYSKHP